MVEITCVVDARAELGENGNERAVCRNPGECVSLQPVPGIEQPLGDASGRGGSASLSA